MKVLIDGDILLYRIGYTTEDVSPWIARARMDETINNIMEATDGNQFHIYLSDDTKNTFRYRLFDGYKATRTQPRPKHYEFLKIYLIEEYAATIVPELEADDALGINQNENTLIASIDKDLLQIPGLHYNFVKHEHKFISPFAGLKWFYQQMLIGDTIDNITGCPGIGPKKSELILEGCTTEEELFESTLLTYIKQTEEDKENLLERFRLVGRLVRIMQHEDEGLWDFPVPMETVDEIWESGCALRHSRRRKKASNRGVSSGSSSV